MRVNDRRVWAGLGCELRMGKLKLMSCSPILFHKFYIKQQGDMTLNRNPVWNCQDKGVQFHSNISTGNEIEYTPLRGQVISLQIFKLPGFNLNFYQGSYS